MSINSINTNIAAYSAQSNIGKASSSAASSIARLSSGNRIVRSSDDVAALSAGTSLRTNVTTLRVALINSSQGSSLLQVADGALSQVTDILQRQKAIAVQAGSGSISDTERSFLNQEFQNLATEIDRLVDNTNFNGVNLLDGSLAEKVGASTNATNAIQGRISIDFTANFTAGQTIVLNGQTIAQGTGTFAIGGTISQTLDNLVSYLNSQTNGAGALALALNQATYSRTGNSLVITARTGGDINNFFTGTGTNTGFTVSGATGQSYHTVFTTALTAVSADADLTAATTTALQPLKDGDVIKLNVGAAAATTITTLAANGTYSLNNLIQDINAQTANTGVTARLVGTSGAYNVLLTHNNPLTVAGTGDDITFVAGANANAAAAVSASTNTVSITNYTVSNQSNTGLARGDVIGVGTIGDNVVNTQTQTKSRVQLVFPTLSNLSDLAGSAITFNDNVAATTGDLTFTFSAQTGTARSQTEASIGTTLEETLDNMVAAINAAQGNGSFEHTQARMQAYREGQTIVLESREAGALRNFDNTNNIGVTLNAAATTLGVSASNGGNISNGSATGISTAGVTNSAFVGTIGGFSATYNGTANTVDAKITVGGIVYEAKSVVTNPAADSTYRFLSANGGYFDVQLNGGTGSTISNQAEANAWAQRLDSAFSSISFYQNRDVSSYNGTDPIVVNGALIGSLAGSRVELSSNNFSGAISIDEIRVNAPVGSTANGEVSFIINGEEYKGSNTLGSQFGANQTYRFVNVNDANKVLSFTTGNSAISFSNADRATAVRTALQEAFGVGNGSANLKFQVGVTSQDTLQVGISKVNTNVLYNGATLDVLSQASASAASDAIDAAIDKVTSVRAEVGAIQSRFNFATANIQSSLQNQDAARGVLLDTDVAAESTAYATSQVQLQAGIAVLAQANQLPQSLLKLIG